MKRFGFVLLIIFALSATGVLISSLRTECRGVMGFPG